MVQIKKLVLDILKPRLPNALDFACALAEAGPGYRVAVEVLEVDEKTETTAVTVCGDNLDYELLEQAVANLGGSVHSIDQVEVAGAPVAE